MSASTQAGMRVELARYRTSTGERVVHGQRVDGVVRVTDKPADETGRSYLVERGLTSQAELEALVDDYVRQSVARDEPAVIVRLGDDLARRLGIGERRSAPHA